MAGTSSDSTDLISRFASLFSSVGKSSTAVGLSIGSSAIKLVELKKIGKSWKLLHFGIVQLPEDVIVNREIVNQIAVVESIKTLVNQLRLSTKSVCTAISGTSIIIKRLSLDVPNMKELQDQVFWEAEQYLPFDISDVVMDYQVLSRAKDNKTEILLVAVKRSVLVSYMDCVTDSGLKPQIVDTDFFALQNVFEANYPAKASEAALIADIGASAMKIIVVQDGQPIFNKDSALGGRNLTAEIQKHLNVSFADAETLKAGSQANGIPQEVSELMHIMSENFATEIKRAVDFYNASSVGAPISFILLTGGSSKIPGLTKVVEDMAGLPTQLLNAFNAISYDPAVFTPDFIASIGPIAAVPIGLALRAGTK